MKWTIFVRSRLEEKGHHESMRKPHLGPVNKAIAEAFDDGHKVVQQLWIHFPPLLPLKNMPNWFSIFRPLCLLMTL